MDMTLGTARKGARALQRALSANGVEVPLAKAYETYAGMHGFASWNAMAASFSAEAIDAQLAEIELDHIEDSVDLTYPAECELLTHTGFALRYDVEDELLTYVRVVDPLGREVASWVFEEWQEDPQLVMGAILGALARGRARVVKRRKPKTK